MFDGLNKYGLPVKYGIVGFIGDILGTFLSKMFGYSDSYIITFSTPIGAVMVCDRWLALPETRKE